MKNNNIRIVLLVLVLFINAKIIAQPAFGTLNPSETDPVCPVVTNTRNFTLELTNVANTDVAVSSQNKLTVTNQTVGNNNTLILTIWFEDQNALNAVVPTLRLKRISDNTLFQNTFEFTKVRLLQGRNVFPASASNQLNIQVPICTQNANISFTKMKYLLAGKPDDGNSLNYFSEVNVYQYILPSGVIPVSGLTPVSGLPNSYTGTNSISVQLSNPFTNATIQVKGISSDCNNVQSTNLNNINILRPQLSVSGVSSIRCGETDTKTFTIQNIPASPNCITNYTWQIANKGWKYNGSIPTTNIVTTTPSIQLQSADNNSAPPQSFSVVVTDGAYSVTLNKSINYLAPNISIPTYAGGFGLDCDITNVNAILTNAPINSYNLSWSTISGYTINGGASPQSSGTVTSVSLEKAGSAGSDFLTVSLQASCGTINSVGGYSFEGCLPWDDFTVNYMSSVPMKPEPIIAYCSTQDQLPWLVEYEWYWFNGSDFTFASNTPGLSFWSDAWPCGVRSLYVRAKGYSGTSALKYVGEYDGYCPGYRTTALVEPDFNVYPNPTNDFVIVKYISLNTAYNIKVTDILGNLKMQFKVKNNSKLDKGLTKIDLSKLKKGKYIIAIQDGKKVKTRIVDKL